jgi:ribosomal protein S13
VTAALTAIVGIASGAIGVLATLVTIRTQMRKDAREQGAADDIESDRIIRLKDVRIAELAVRIDGLQLAVNDLRAKVHDLEQRLDQYGCWNGPHCINRRPLAGPNPNGNI